jgi:osmotically-inducible protein OsmY
MNDLELRRTVENELSWEPTVNPAVIGVAAKDGIVTLTGRVASYWQKISAERAAMRVAGARAIVNELDVELPVTSERTDEDIARAAVNTLTWNASLPSERIKVTVSKGWVTLEGSVEWQYQRREAENVTRRLKGVKGVSNIIEVKPEVSTVQVKSAIEAALKRTAELDARHITVGADGDKVILRGTVRSIAERQGAERAAWSAPGVRCVENHVTINSGLAASA